jgi:DNA mismatch endonuclease (patch repair protein)
MPLVDRRGVTGKGEAAAAEARLGRRTVALGGGLRVPYPEPRDEAATKVGKGNRRTETKPEILLRSALHARGLRFRKDYPIRVPGRRPIRADVVFTKAKVAVFVDGCFWHGCPEHQTIPKSNPDYWIPKLKRNSARDRELDEALGASGWRVVHAWEHEDPDHVAGTVERLVRTGSTPRC